MRADTVAAGRVQAYNTLYSVKLTLHCVVTDFDVHNFSTSYNIRIILHKF